MGKYSERSRATLHSNPMGRNRVRAIKRFFERQCEPYLVGRATSHSVKQSVALVWLAIVAVFLLAPSAWAASRTDSISFVRVIETGRLGHPHPAGLAYSARADSFLVVRTLDGASTYTDTVAGRAGCTYIPLSAVEAQEDGATLQHGDFSQMVVRSVRLDPAGLIGPRG